MNSIAYSERQFEKKRTFSNYLIISLQWNVYITFAFSGGFDCLLLETFCWLSNLFGQSRVNKLNCMWRARGDYVFVVCQTYLVSDWSNHRKAIIKLSKTNQNHIQSQWCVALHYETKTDVYKTRDWILYLFVRQGVFNVLKNFILSHNFFCWSSSLL